MVGDKGKVEGVKLRDGTEIFSKVVLSNATPHITFLKMLSPKRLPEAYLKKIRSVDYSSPVTKINGMWIVCVISCKRADEMFF